MKIKFLILLSIFTVKSEIYSQNTVTTTNNQAYTIGSKNNTSENSISAKILMDTVIDIDGNVYHTIKIGTQTWMLENLKVTHYRNGDPVFQEKDSTKWYSLNKGAYCNYRNDSIFAKKHGRLYNGLAIVDKRNIAPTGWHIPSDTDLMILTNYCQLKDTGILREIPLNLDFIEINFTALKGGDGYVYGNRWMDGRVFGHVNDYVYWWSSTESASQTLYCYYMTYLYRSRQRVAYNKQCGYSVCCVKD